MTTPTLLDRARDVILATQFGFNHRRCPVCAGWNVGPNGETDKVHTATCPVALVFADLDRARADNGWLPIESAPKDGTLFLCWVSAERWSCIDGGGSGRSADTSEVDFCQWKSNSGDGYFMNMMGQIGDMQDITHWMPLPAPPIATESTSQEVGNGE